MKENFIIQLSELIGDDTAFGNDEGREVYLKLLTELDSYPNNKVVGISLSGITRTDASFPRESVISLAKAKNGETGFYLKDFATKDLMDNWNYAAIAKDQSIIVITEDSYELLGKDIGLGPRLLLDFIMDQKTVTTSTVAEKLNVSAQNASGKLKKLAKAGLILSTKQIAETGGIEYVFTSII